MPNSDAFPAVFAQLKAMLAPFAPRLLVQEDTPASFALAAPASAKYPKGLYFGGVQIKKNYVSYHLLPVYVYPDLLDDLPAPLTKRMQGKSCFNFTRLDAEMAADLDALTARSFERCRREGVV